MKSWKPRAFGPLPPLPEFIGRWQVATASDETVIGALRDLARVALRRGRAALRGLLGEETGSGEMLPDAPQVPDDRTVIVNRRPPARARAVLPMSSGTPIRPSVSATITSRPQTTAFLVERIVIGGNPDHWVVNDIKIGRCSQLLDSGDLPGSAFAPDAKNTELRLDAIGTAVKFSMTVTYIGPDPQGEPFLCTAVGFADSSLPEGMLVPDRDDADPTLRLPLPLSSGVAILPNTTAQVTADPQDPFRPERIVIGGNPDHWVVNDVKVGNRSQFVQAGDVPGEMFAATMADSPVSFETAQVAMQVSIIVTYIGPEELGEFFLACAIGSVPR